MPQIYQLALLDQVSPGDQLPVYDVANGDTRRLPISELENYIASNIEASTDADDINFLQAGTGAVTRTVQSKLRDVVSVKDFGAVGDGVTDDRAAINLAIASGAKSVYFPAGTYRVSAQLECFVSGVTLWTDNEATIKPTDGVATGFGMLRVRGSNTTIEGLTFDGNTAAPPVSGNNSGISLDTNSGTLTDISFRNCTFQNFESYGVFAFNSGTLIDVSFDGCEFTGFTSTAPTPPGAIQLVQPLTSNVRVDNCYFKALTSAGVAIRSVAGTDIVENVTITGCIFDHGTSAYTTIGAEIWDARNLSVAGNTFKNARMGLSIFGENIAVSGNTFDNETSYCIEAGQSVNLSVAGNSFSNFKYGLIHYNGASDVSITGNTFRNALPGSTTVLNLGWAVQQSAAGGATNYQRFIISDNVFYNCSGVRLEDPNAAIISQNIFETTSTDNLCRLIFLDDLSTRVSVTDNIFKTSVSFSGISVGLLQFSGTAHNITDNAFISTTGSVNAGSAILTAPGGVISNVVIDGVYAENFSYGLLLNNGFPTTTNVSVANVEGVNNTVNVLGQAGVEVFFGPAKAGYGTFGDADFTITARVSRVVRNAQTLSANRTITLDGTGVTPGTEYFVYRQGAGDFTLDVGGLATLNRFESCRVFWTGSAWELADYRPQSYRTIYQNSRSDNYTLVLADSGKQIFHPASDNNPRTFTIPANSSVIFPIGTEITFINMINTVTIAITSDTLTQAGTGTTGSRTLAAYGWARAVKIGATEWLIDGTGLT